MLNWQTQRFQTMEAKPINLSKIFTSGGEIHYVLPHFQRQYSWDLNNWNVLWKDVLAVYNEYSKKSRLEHFLGSIVVIQDGNVSGTIQRFKLVDGQQRLTSLSLLLCAFRDLIESINKKIFNKISRLLINEDEEDDSYFKLLPTEKYGDREAYKKLILAEFDLEKDSFESTIPNAYEFFYRKLEGSLRADEIDPDRFTNALLNSFQVVFISLNSDESPYKIFESLNAKGKDLTQADLVRNYIAMKLPLESQEKAFKKYWEPIETRLQEQRSVGKSRIGELTAFIRHYLAMCSRNLCSKENIYERFRNRCENLQEDSELIAELKELNQCSDYYDRLLRPDHEPNNSIRRQLKRLSIFDISTGYPFLLSVYSAWDTQDLSEDQFLEILRITENYLVRRYITGKQTNYLNKMFPSLWRDICNLVSDEIDVVTAFRQLILTKNYPTDKEVVNSIQTSKIYKRQHNDRIYFLLESINKNLSRGTDGFTVLNNDPSVEHILPQTPEQSWKDSLGDDFQETYKDYLDTLGNLTLVTIDWNRALSNRSFEVKKGMLANHALKINSEYFSQDLRKWGSSEILNRAILLGEKILEIWPALGVAQLSVPETHGKPKNVIIRDEVIPVPNNTWRQVMQIVTEWVIKNYTNQFETARSEVSSYFSDNLNGKRYPKDWHQLSNGLWVYHSNSAKAHLSFCGRLLRGVGIRESEWKVEEIYSKDQT